MPSLSTPIAELQSRYDVIVIGSGYGGAIAAHRMAEAARLNPEKPDGGLQPPAFSVCVLERGLERLAGDYPETSAAAVRDIQIDSRRGRVGPRTGLFDFRVNDDVSVLVGCGLGGTSQINAGVMLKPHPSVFLKEWPKTLSTIDVLEKEYADVERDLGVNRFPPTMSLSKVTWLMTGAERLDGPAAEPAPIAVSFSTGINRFNVQRQRCVLCGNCITGCNHSAKNTVQTNFLAGAANLGAAIFCGMQVQAIEKDGTDWLLHVRIEDPSLATFGSPEIPIRARMVFLAAGTLGSTEILLRSRERFGLAVSPVLGHHFSGNGDAIAFAYNGVDQVDGVGYGARMPPEPVVGPTIAAMMYDQKKGGLMIQEGAIPGALALPLRFLAPLMARMSEFPLGRIAGTRQQIWREIDSMIRGVRYGALARTQTFLAMAEDNGTGQMGLSDNRLRIKWNDAGDQRVYKNIAVRLAQLTKVMHGRYVINPFWSRMFGRRLMTVHPLGGCRLADDVRHGVVNAEGQVFDAQTDEKLHDGLYVCDGSIIPRALGINPALTISALAERIARKAAARGMPGVTFPIPPPSRVDRSVPGLRYAERIRGRTWANGTERRLELVLQISIDDIKQFFESANHEARIIGVAHVPDADKPSEQRWTVSDGTLRVLVDDPRHVETKLLAYQLKLTAKSGRNVWLSGHKTINYETLRRHPWLTITRFPFVLFNEKPVPATNAAGIPIEPYAGCRVVELWDRTRDVNRVLSQPGAAAVGVVGCNIADAARLVLSMRAQHERRSLPRLRLKCRFAWWCIDTIIQLRAWPIRRTRVIDPLEEPKGLEPSTKRLRPVLYDQKPNLPKPRFSVSRYNGSATPERQLRPVLLAPGFGMSSYAFQAAGDGSFAEYLFTKGYDVWLLDYRASDMLDISLDQFDVDDLASGDFPDAIKRVYEATGKPVQVIAHCVASLAMQMALLKEPSPDPSIPTIDPRTLHSVMLSQSYAFIDHPFVNRLKATLRLPDVLSYLNFKPVLTADFDARSSLRTRLLDRLLHFYPSRERCCDGVCRRLLMMYGEVFRHDQLDKDTHDSIYHLFDRANLTMFRHLGKMIARGQILDRCGKDVYLLPQNAKRITVPITLLQGKANGLFRPAGMRKTHRWLVEHGGFDSPAHNAAMFEPLEIDGYGHLDNFIGRNAAGDVWGKIAGALEAMDEKVKGLAEDDSAA
jgi:cholesterol oxidase